MLIDPRQIEIAVLGSNRPTPVLALSSHRPACWYIEDYSVKRQVGLKDGPLTPAQIVQRRRIHSG